MKIVILGSTGMLGNVVGRYFIERYGEDSVVLSDRNVKLSYGKNRFSFIVGFDRLDSIPKCDYIINCIGVIKPFIAKNVLRAIQVNSVFPWQLAKYCEENFIKLIHITTDCVFSGKDGYYAEEDCHDCTDIYGKTKSLGEPDNCMVLRTSIIGEELHNNASLISWLKSRKNQEATGYTNHWWNGITTLQYAKICCKIIDFNLHQNELYHIFSNPINKYDLLKLLNEKFNLNIDIQPFKVNSRVDRTLITTKHFCKYLDIPSITQQIEEM